MKTFFKSIALLLLILATSCSPKYFNTDTFNKMKWIEGKWVSTDDGIDISEEWVFLPKIGFDGINVVSLEKDTLFIEYNQIRMGEKKSIVFKSELGHLKEDNYKMNLVRVKSKSIIFKIPNGEKTLTYTNKGNNQIQITVIDYPDDKKNTTTYLLKKINN